MSRSKSKSIAPISFASLHESDEEVEEEFHGSINPQKDVNSNVPKVNESPTFARSPQKTIIKSNQENEAIKPIVPPRTYTMKMESPITVKKGEVADHPLAHNSSSSSLSSMEGEQETASIVIRKKNDVPQPVPSVNSQPPQTHETKTKLTDALFNPKARSQLFTNLKKNIHYYTGASHEGPELKRFQYARMMRGSEESESDKSEHLPSSSDSKLLKDFKERVSELKKAWDEPLKTDNKDSSEVKRIRSSSDSNMALSNAESRMSNRRNDVESTLMSFSQLAVKQRQKDDSISVNSNVSEDFTVATASNEESKSEPKQESPIEIPAKETPESTQQKSHEFPASPSYVSPYNVLFLSFFVYLYFTLPLPHVYTIYINAFVFGVIFAVGFLCLFAASSNQIPVKIDRPYVNYTAPYKIPLALYDPGKSYKGWMNELMSYDPDTYHVSHTQSVYVTLERTTLRLQTPRKNVSRRETFEDERVPPLSNVIYQRILDISHAKVYLLPPGLVKKRVWSKKYPICVELPLTAGNKQERSTSSDSSEHDSGEENGTTQHIYLFGRTQPQKEEWFYRIQRSIRLASIEEAEKNKANSSDDEEAEVLDIDSMYVSPKLNSPTVEMREYYMYMCRLLPDPNVYKEHVKRDLSDHNSLSTPVAATNSSVHFSSHEPSTPVVLSQPRVKTVTSPDTGEPGLEVAWFNALIGRIMFDFLRSDKWAKWVSVKIQKKLDKIKLPYFINGLQLTDIDLGMTVPLIHKVSLPRIDEKGTWLEMEITYNGSIQLTLETKCVLTKLGKQTHDEEMTERPHHQNANERSAITNSDEEDSAESSDEEESAMSRIVSQVQNVVANVGPTEGALATPIQYLTSSSSDNVLAKKSKTEKPKSETYTPPSTPVSSGNAGAAQQGKRWMRIVDSITKNKYFQKATETKYIRRKLETVSNTPLVLTAELQQLHGSMSVNIPPPPTDRIWYGFSECPYLVLKAHPKFGERAVTMTHVTDWIAKKLKQEFNKVLVMPNMEDVPIPVMYSNIAPT